jgi:hypothetical protein
MRKNSDVLVDSHWIGGDPGKGEVYGFASWSPRKGILVLRNPTDKPARFEVDVQLAFELPASAPRQYRLQSPWEGTAAPEEPTAVAGQPWTVQLAPLEALVLDAFPTTQEGTR